MTFKEIRWPSFKNFSFILRQNFFWKPLFRPNWLEKLENAYKKLDDIFAGQPWSRGSTKIVQGGVKLANRLGLREATEENYGWWLLFLLVHFSYLIFIYKNLFNVDIGSFWAMERWLNEVRVYILYIHMMWYVAPQYCLYIKILHMEMHWMSNAIWPESHHWQWTIYCGDVLYGIKKTAAAIIN